MSELNAKFMKMLEESIEDEKPHRGRPKANKNSLEAIEKEFEDVKDDEKKLNKLIMKYGNKEEGDVAKIVRKYMKYQKKTATDYLDRDLEAEHSVRVKK